MRAVCPRVTVRALMIRVAVAGLLSGYVASYLELRQRGIREAGEYGLAGFLYVPVREAAAAEDLSRHYVLSLLYAPLNWVDRTFFGGPSPTDCIIWRLSG